MDVLLYERFLLLQSVAVSAHPSLFDEFFKGLRWRGSEHVKVVTMDGGVNQLKVVVEADDQGCLELKTAKFNVRAETG